MAWNLHAIEQAQLRRQHCVDGVGRLKYTGGYQTSPVRLKRSSRTAVPMACKGASRAASAACVGLAAVGSPCCARAARRRQPVGRQHTLWAPPKHSCCQSSSDAGNGFQSHSCCRRMRASGHAGSATRFLGQKVFSLNGFFFSISP